MTHNKNQPHTLVQPLPSQNDPNNILLLLQAPSGTRSCGDIDDLKFFIEFAKKNLGQRGLKFYKQLIVFQLINLVVERSSN